MTFSLINGIIESINSWFLRVAQTTSDRCRMVSLWTAVERAWYVLTVLDLTDSLIKGESKEESLVCFSRCCVEGDVLSGLLSGWSLLLLALVYEIQNCQAWIVCLCLPCRPFWVLFDSTNICINVCEKVTLHPQMKLFTNSQLNKVCIGPSECYMKCL